MTLIPKFGPEMVTMYRNTKNKVSTSTSSKCIARTDRQTQKDNTKNYHFRIRRRKIYKGSLETMLNSLEEWTKPKVDEIAAYMQLRALNQGNKTLSEYIQEVRIGLVDLCNLDCDQDKDKF